MDLQIMDTMWWVGRKSEKKHTAFQYVKNYMQDVERYKAVALMELDCRFYKQFVIQLHMGSVYTIPSDPHLL